MPRKQSGKRTNRKRRPTTRGLADRHRDEWIGGRLSAPFFIGDREEPERPELVIWMDSHELIVGQDLLAPQDAAGALARTLLSAMEHPLIGPRRRPSAIRVADRSLAAEVRDAVGSRIPIRVAPTPELDALLESMVESLSEQPGSEGQSASYLDNGRIPVETIAEFFAAAKLLYESSPWTVMNDDQVVRLDIPKYEVGGACLAIIGNLRESFGAVVFPSFADYVAFVGSADPSSLPKGVRPDFGTSWLALSFERGADLPALMRREAAVHAWPVAAPDAYPCVARFDSDGTPYPTRPQDLQIAAAVAAAFSRFFAAHRAVFEREHFDPVCESYSVLDGVEVRLTAPAWSSPLPGSGAGVGALGSGAADKRAPHPMHDLDLVLVKELEDFALAQFGRDWLRFERDFEDAAEAVQLAAPWSIFHYRVGQQSVLEAYMQSAPRRLTCVERAWLEAQHVAWLSVWEVIAVDPGASLMLRDLLSGEERFVHEVGASATLELRDAVLARVVDHADGPLLCGTHPRSLPPRDAAEVVRRARARLRRRRQVPLERLRDEGFARYLIRRWEEAVDGFDAWASVPPELRNTDGDLLLLTTDHFRIEPTATPAVEARLATMEEARRLASDEDGKRVYAFVRPDDGQPESRPDTVFGFARVSETSLRLETNSRARADALRARVERACGKQIQYRAREHADPTSDAVVLRPPGPAPATSVPEEALLEFKRRHYADWSDHPLPALNGMTPREAVRTAGGRAAVDTLLKEMENQEQRVPGAAFDFSELRRDLRLE